MRSTNALSSMSLASGSTVDLGTADGESVQITGTATISSFGTSPAGIVRECRFAAALTISASSNIATPAGADITVSAGDVIVFRSMGSGAWKFVSSSASTIAGTAGLQAALDAKANLAGPVFTAQVSQTGPFPYYGFNPAGSGSVGYLGMWSGTGYWNITDAPGSGTSKALTITFANGPAWDSQALWHAGNFNPASKLDASATAAAATKLATARNIAGKPFDVTADVSIAAADVGAPSITGASAIVVTTTLPGSPDGSTLYFLTS
jgi:hypothetical protein